MDSDQPVQTQIKKAPSLAKLQLLLDNNLTDEVNAAIKEFKLKLEIYNGRIVDASNKTDWWLSRFLTVHPVMLQLKEDAKRLAPVQDEVLITGETGTGKEIIARALHGNREGSFTALNCAGLPDQLVESELFGHVKGAFTGAEGQKIGLLARASGGTIFLDEIGEMPILTQAKLLRAIQEHKIRKVGAVFEENIDCRFVCATHRDLKSMIDKGQFRLDLYARLSTFELHTLPLKERPEDIPLILDSLEGGKELAKVTTKFDLSLNVRSLQQAVRRYKVLGKI